MTVALNDSSIKHMSHRYCEGEDFLIYIFFFHMLNGFELHQFSSDLEIICVDILKHL